MWLRRFLYVAGATAALTLLCATVATAGQGWQPPVEGSRSLGFGATYQAADGSTNVHGGLDIAAGPGTRVRACTSGEIVFAGKVPAGEGAQAFAVTILTEDGLRVTLLPLTSVSVSAGSDVEAGEAVGVLASGGDASTGATHLHLGVKRGSTRLDPASFLAEGVTEPATPKSSAPAPAAAPQASKSHAAIRPYSAARPASAARPTAAPVAGAAVAAITAGQVPVSAGDALASAANAVATSLDAAPRLRRVPSFKTTHVLSVPRMWHDITDLRGALGKGALTAVLALVAAGCLVTVLRTAAASAQEAGAVLAPVPHEHS